MTTTKRRLLAASAIVAAIVAVLLVLAGCGAETYSGVSPVRVSEIGLPDGRTVICVIVDGLAVDCDFEGAR